MSNLLMWNLVIAFFMPLVVAAVQQPTWPSWLRVVVSGVAAVIGGLGTAYFNDDFNTGDIVGSILVVLVATIAFYKNWWKPTGVASAIENATSKTPPAVESVHPDGAPRSGSGGIANPLTGDTERGASEIAYIIVVAVIALIFLAVFFQVVLPAMR